MGSRYSAHCSSCGFDSYTDTGYSVSQEGKDYHPIHCPTCKRIGRINLEKPDRRCTRCRSAKIRLYGDETRDPASIELSSGRDTEWHEGKHICPKCQSHHLTFDLQMLFD